MGDLIDRSFNIDNSLNLTTFLFDFIYLYILAKPNILMFFVFIDTSKYYFVKSSSSSIVKA